MRIEVDENQKISVKELLDYCQKCADTARRLWSGVSDKVGHGESECSALGALAYFRQQELLFRYEVPDLILSFLRKEEAGE